MEFTPINPVATPAPHDVNAADMPTDAAIVSNDRSPSVEDELDAQIQDQLSQETSAGLNVYFESPSADAGDEQIEDDEDEEAEAGHYGQCSGSPGADTPCVSPSSTTSTVEDLTAADIAPEIREHNLLHQKALGLKPMVPSGRYCIGILNPAKLPKNVRRQEDFLWMKAHGGITINTVWYQYSQQTGIGAGFKLRIRGFIPDMDMVMRELDFFNDKHVILRAVHSVAIDD